MAEPTEVSAPRLELLKALGDNTRYAIYLELARAPAPLATAQIADTLGLHANTVRPHLDRMREVGLLEVVTDAQGAVGARSTATRSPPMLHPSGSSRRRSPCWRGCSSASPPAPTCRPADAVEAGREQGIVAAAGRPGTCAEALTHELAALGFDPESVVDDDGATIAFTRCPFRELAEANPDLVCSLHRGLVEGFVDARGDGEVVAFHDLADRTPCQVEIATGPPVALL